jgi:hypothetical protein
MARPKHTLTPSKEPRSKSAPKPTNILEVERQAISFRLLGTRPIILNRISEKAGHELLLPKGRLSRADKQTHLKHDPLREFRDSPHRFNNEQAPTYLAVPAGGFKKGMVTVAGDLPGAKKLEVSRLVWVDGILGTDYVPLYGIPQITLDPVRSADQRRTPDIRSRAIVPVWATELRVMFVKPLIRAEAIVRFLLGAGLYVGVGDWRNEKGSNTYGGYMFVRTAEETKLWEQIVATGGRQAQIAAMAAPQPYNEQTSELLAWFDTEISRRKRTGIGVTPREPAEDEEDGDLPLIIDNDHIDGDIGQ